MRMRLAMPSGRRFRVLVLAVAAAVISSSAAVRSFAADWPNWRGPNYNGISDETGWQTNWPEGGPERLWKKDVGIGYSSVTVSKGRLYTMGHKAGQDTIWCLNAKTGKLIWKHSYQGPGKPRGGYVGNRATPTVDGQHVYTLSLAGYVLCLRADSGKVVWKNDLGRGLGAKPPQWGYAGSVLVHGRLLILNVGTAGVALDKAGGKVVWKTGPGTAGYSTPFLYEMGGRKCVALFNADSIVGLNVTNGRRLWSYPWKNSCDVNASDPIISGDKVFITSGYRIGCALLRITGGKAEALWRNRKLSMHFNCPVLWKGHIYGFDLSRQLKCLDFQTGQVKWSRRGFGSKSSLMIAGGKMVIMEQRGTLVVAEPSPAGYKELARAKVMSGTCWTVPVLSGGRIYCRSHQGELLCLNVGPKPADNSRASKQTHNKPKDGQDGSAENKLKLARVYLKTGLRNKAKSILLEIVRDHKGTRHEREAQRLLDRIK